MQIIWILLISMFQMSQMGMNGVLESIRNAFPSLSAANIQLVATMPDIFIMLSSIIVGILLRNKKIKPFLVLSIVLYSLSGMIGFIFHASYHFVLISSAILGVAIGTMMPSVNIWIKRKSKGNEERVRNLGLQSTAVNIGGMIIVLVAGIIPPERWYFIYCIFFLVIFFLPFFVNMKEEVSKENELNSIMTETDRKTIIFFSIGIAVFFSLYSVLSANISFLVSERQYYSVNAGVLLAVLFSGSVVSGLFISQINNRFQGNTLYMGIIVLGISMLGISFCTSVCALLIFLFLGGSTLSIVMTECSNSLMEKLSTSATEIGVAIMLACSDGGGFATPIYTMISEVTIGKYSASFTYFLSGVLACILAVIWKRVTYHNSK